MNYFIDTHCHLDYLKSSEIKGTLHLAHLAQVEKIITIAVDLHNQQTVVDIAQEFSNVYCTQGIHPHHAKDWNNDIKELIQSNLKNKKVRAIGEIGLDYHYNHSSRAEQLNAFEAQLQLAIENNLPVIIHSREAEEDTMDVLTNFASKLRCPVAIHSFTSSLSMAEFALTQGMYIGFNGIITFKAAENVRQVLHITPLSRLLLETDAPFLAPIPHRGKENGPQYIPVIAQKMAELKTCTLSEIMTATSQNAIALYGLP